MKRLLTITAILISLTASSQVKRIISVVGTGGGGSADSSVFATNFRVDTAKTNIYALISTGGSDTLRIPYTGTPAWRSITGNLKFDGVVIPNKIYASEGQRDFDLTLSDPYAESARGLHLYDSADGYFMHLRFPNTNSIEIATDNPAGGLSLSLQSTSRGIMGGHDYSANLQPFDYIQKALLTRTKDTLNTRIDSVITNMGGGSLTASNFVFNEVPSGTINSSNVTFTLANTPTAGTVQLFLNNVPIFPPAYSVSGSTVTMGTAPLTGSTLYSHYLK